MLVKDCFQIRYGQRQIPFSKQKEGSIPFISSRGSNFGIMGYVDLTPNAHFCLTIARNGSVGSCFFHDYDCICNDDVLILEPIFKCSQSIMIYYSLILTKIGTNFNYARKITPDRLGAFEIPSLEEIPEWVNEIEMPNFDYIKEAKSQEKVELPDFSKWKNFKLTDLFDIKKASGPKISEAKNNLGITPYISATAENNGIALYCNAQPTQSGHCITVGHLADCFYQVNDFVGSNVTILDPKFKGINQQIGLFLSTLLNANKYKYSYGRVIGIKRLEQETIALPVDEQGEPNWQLMEDYINSLPYSATL